MTNKLNIQLLTAAVLTFAGIGLLYLGALLAPQGEIHETILVAFGEIATFAGSILGIDYHYKQKYSNHENPTNQKTNDHRPSTNDQSSRSRLHRSAVQRAADVRDA